jgi:(1->4)-alpha-D-glucan 1-alpha-D-glucosylmutase
MSALNEVGSDLQSTTINAFHLAMQQRNKSFPHSLSATTTHDTKRSEDTRSRIAVLSEIPKAWEEAIVQFGKIVEFPEPNLEYLFYQTLVGTWPLEVLKRSEFQEYRERILNYMVKAAKEQKEKTSWMDPDENFQKNLRNTILDLLRIDSPFISLFKTFIEPLILPGLFNALSMLVLKMAAPGVPDFYEGTELWDFSLVDPDNRRWVDFGKRRWKLNQPGTVDQMLEKIHDGHLKLFMMQKMLQFRRENRDLFSFGDYYPIEVEGAIAFSRSYKDKSFVCVAKRFFVDPQPCLLKLDEKRYRDLFTGDVFEGSFDPCKKLPAAVLVRE